MKKILWSIPIAVLFSITTDAQEQFPSQPQGSMGITAQYKVVTTVESIIPGGVGTLPNDRNQYSA